MTTVKVKANTKREFISISPENYPKYYNKLIYVPCENCYAIVTYSSIVSLSNTADTWSSLSRAELVGNIVEMDIIYD